MSLAHDSFNRGAAAPGRGLGAEERIARTIDLARDVFLKHGPMVKRWAGLDPAAWPADLPPALAADAEWLARARALAQRHANGLALVEGQARALVAARGVKVPYQRQQQVFAIPVALAQGAAAAFLDEHDALAERAGVRPAAVATAVSAGPTAPAPAAPRAATGRLGGLLDRVAGRLSRPAQDATPVPSMAARVLAEIETVLAEVRKLYGYTAERMVYVEKAVALRTQRGSSLEGLVGDAPPRVRQLVEQLAVLFGRSAPVMQRCQVALGQTAAVRVELQNADRIWSRVAALPPEQAAGEARAIDLATLRGKAVPLANLPRTFQADPILRQLFPPATPAAR